MSKKLVITISEEMFRNVEKAGALFPWMTKDSPDYGDLIEELCGWKFDQLIEQNNGALYDEISNFLYDDRQEAERMIQRAIAHDPELAPLRTYEKGGRWLIAGWETGGYQDRILDTCAEMGLDFEEHLAEFEALIVGASEQRNAVVPEYLELLTKRKELAEAQAEHAATMKEAA